MFRRFRRYVYNDSPEMRTLESQCRADSKRMKQQLINKAIKNGLYENFGEKESRKLRDKYGAYRYKSQSIDKTLDEFDNWRMNFDLRELQRYKRNVYKR